jgi:hypothetical protein
MEADGSRWQEKPAASWTEEYQRILQQRQDDALARYFGTIWQ